MTALGLAVTSACARAPGSSHFAPGPAFRRRLARVQVSPDRVIRTVTGLRPFRPSGFVVRAERRDSKVLIHNYGHGGGGVTLSWGTAQLAVDEALQTGQRAAAVLGCGAVGLASARLLQQHGGTVTIYARDLPPNTTSNIAGAQWSPYSVFDEDRLTPEFEAQYVRASHIAYRSFPCSSRPALHEHARGASHLPQRGTPRLSLGRRAAGREGVYGRAGDYVAPGAGRPELHRARGQGALRR